MFRILIFFTAIVPLRLWAFPSIINHGYTSCMTCHYSPTGGGLLNSYGKIIAGELFGAFNDSSSAIRFIKEPEEGSKYDVGVLIRMAQTHYEDEDIKIAKFRRMQGDIELGVTGEQLFAFVTGGIKGAAAREGEGESESDFNIRRFWVGSRALTYSFRVGQFIADYGINHPNHNLPTRKGLYFDQGQEPHIAQGNLFFKWADLGLAYIEGRKDTSFEERSGYAATAIFKTNMSRNGISEIDFSNDSVRDHSRSIFTQFGINEYWYLLAEFAVRTVDSATQHNRYELGFAELGWEWRKGLIPYLGYEHKALTSGNTLTAQYVAGARIYPATHFELMIQGARVKNESATRTQYGTSSFVMLNVFF